jgi:hypothetical protein
MGCFNGPLPSYTGPAGFVQYEDRVRGLDSSSLALIKRLDLAMKVMDGEESHPSPNFPDHLGGFSRMVEPT